MWWPAGPGAADRGRPTTRWSRRRYSSSSTRRSGPELLLRAVGSAGRPLGGADHPTVGVDLHNRDHSRHAETRRDRVTGTAALLERVDWASVNARVPHEQRN